MLEQLKAQAQNKGFKINHQEFDNTTIFEIRTKDERLIFARCETGHYFRIKAHREATTKLQELLN